MALEGGGWWSPGTIGSEEHEGEPLGVDEIKALADGTEVIITWAGGNGPHRYRIVRQHPGALPCAQTMRSEPSPLFKWSDQRIPLHRVTLARS